MITSTRRWLRSVIGAAPVGSVKVSLIAFSLISFVQIDFCTRLRHEAARAARLTQVPDGPVPVPRLSIAALVSRASDSSPPLALQYIAATRTAASAVAVTSVG